MPVEPQPAHTQPTLLGKRGELKEARELVALIAELHEFAARFDDDALAWRQMIERRVQGDVMNVRPGGNDAIAQHLMALVEMHERELSKPVDFRQCFAKGLNGTFTVH